MKDKTTMKIIEYILPRSIGLGLTLAAFHSLTTGAVLLDSLILGVIAMITLFVVGFAAGKFVYTFFPIKKENKEE